MTGLPPDADSGGDPYVIDLIAYRLHPGDPMPIVTAPSRRAWMDATDQSFAYRCLPMKIANEAGWLLLSSQTLTATWDGGPARESVTIDHLSGEGSTLLTSHFGHGIVTWSIPYLFRTSPGYDLLFRGPANMPKDGATALEGLVETDWTVATATMNWKLTRPGLTVRFDAGEPVCMLVPQAQGILESVRPRAVEIEADPDLGRRHRDWAAGRVAFNASLPERAGAAAKDLWQKDYFLGRDADARPKPGHRKKLRLRTFDSAHSAPFRLLDTDGVEK